MGKTGRRVTTQNTIAGLLFGLLLLGTMAHPVAADELRDLYNQYQALNKKGQYRKAIPVAKRVLELGIAKFGKEHKNVGVFLNDLAGLYYKQGRYAEAEPLYKRDLAIKEKALGKQHPSVATTLNNLAGLYESQGRYAEAEPLYKRDLAITEKALGKQHPSVATTLNNLAGLYKAQGRYAEAEPLYKRDLAITEKALGKQHPSVATTLNNLAGLYESQGRYAEAEPLYKRSLNIKEKALGKQHPSVATTLNNLAGLYKAQGRYAEAEPLYKRTLSINEKALGKQHPSVATTLNNLAGLYESQGRYAEAEPLYKRSLNIKEKALGKQHPSVATTLNNLAGLYESQGRYAEAEPFYRRSVTLLEKAYGSDHPSIRIALANLADLYRDTKQPDKAAPLEKRLSMMAVPGTKDAILLYATNRVVDDAKSSTDNQRFSGGRGTELSFGMARVQMSGKLLKALAKRGLQNLTNDKLRNQGVLTSAKDLTIRSAVKLDGRDALFAKAKIALNHSSVNKNQILIFVHGYNVSFEDALKRAAQIKLDMGFDGAIIPFSWPSKASLAGYGTDRDSADIAVNHLFRFIEQLSTAMPDAKIHFVAHSMGNMVLLGALEKLAQRAEVSKRHYNFGELVMAHADVDSTRLVQLVKEIKPLGMGHTLYINKGDWALWFSGKVRGEKRAGGEVLVIDGVQTIDTSRLNNQCEKAAHTKKQKTRFWQKFKKGWKNLVCKGKGKLKLNHDVFIRNRALFGDLSRLLRFSVRPPHNRSHTLRQTKTKKTGLTYWEFKKAQ